ncbi:hypothetical protein A3D85_01945 [Candidatus Amesbacteria bacterium RIFCSPHIGHO2_02_FULL_47_9]|uniref:DUF2304 domain-containing protein n=1 Tax=Candidatus Amesbacteria bacterium RIFCSPHIGHO2_01_FULL_48_32b TaxID=1797253 RepID=A0A1F4YDT4_9BACT|nr:MAG: hypothetical protein A2876_02575 [Candidatus Amesbacteria bacterium RIFCSPHIGHO2_01_FULL_48_32b]OGD04529.1 MAG: hypothetical protein A3D85_01945 [Candidatus Amesbacteria bacterium RIFCSPHIGHO2_02_FULL_47_9]OGD08101.1 MAG: hypothetical protein A2899_02020 [Candidatus Amesbacteria bacterium RIFCSPLOWO2_01_FULL_49_25]
MVEALLGIQIIAVMFAAFMLYVAFVHRKQGNITRREFVYWLLVWVSFTYFALNPRILDPILARLFVTRAMDLLSIVAFMILAYLGFQNHVGIKSLQRQIEEISRNIAYKNAKTKKRP